MMIETAIIESVLVKQLSLRLENKARNKAPGVCSQAPVDAGQCFDIDSPAWPWQVRASYWQPRAEEASFARINAVVRAAEPRWIGVMCSRCGGYIGII